MRKLRYILHSLDTGGRWNDDDHIYGVKGAARLAKYASLWEHAMTDEAKRRIKILFFWEKYGFKATLDAFSTKRCICLCLKADRPFSSLSVPGSRQTGGTTQSDRTGLLK